MAEESTIAAPVDHPPEEFAKVLSADRPDADRRRLRWSRLQPLVQPLTASGALAEIAEPVQSLF